MVTYSPVMEYRHSELWPARETEPGRIGLYQPVQIDAVDAHLQEWCGAGWLLVSATTLMVMLGSQTYPMHSFFWSRDTPAG